MTALHCSGCMAAVSISCRVVINETLIKVVIFFWQLEQEKQHSCKTLNKSFA
jgi:hypothetical protein